MQDGVECTTMLKCMNGLKYTSIALYFVLLLSTNGWCYTPASNPHIKIEVIKRIYPSQMWRYKVFPYSDFRNFRSYSPDKKHYLQVVNNSNNNLRLLSTNGAILMKELVGFIFCIRIGNSFFVYSDSGPYISAVWKPGGSNDKDTMEWLQTHVKYYVRSTYTGKLLCCGSVINKGLPVAITGNKIWCVRISNPINYFLNGRKPHIAIDIRHAKNASLIAEINIPYSMELQYDPALDSEPLKDRIGDFWQLIPYSVINSRHKLTINFGDSEPHTNPENSIPKANSKGMKIVWRYK